MTDSTPADGALAQAQALVRGVVAFTQDMRDASIHVGMTLDGSVLCVNCGAVWAVRGELERPLRCTMKLPVLLERQPAGTGRTARGPACG